MEPIYNDLCNKLMLERTAFHILHLSSTSYAQHMALGDVYNTLNDAIDELSEHIQGMCLELLNLSVLTEEIPRGPSVPLSRITGFINYLNRCLPQLKDQSLANKVQELIHDLRGAAYKLRFLS